MSTPMKKEVICPDCGSKTTIEIHRCIDIKSSSDLRKKAFRHMINDFICPKCGNEITEESRYFIYHDEDKKFAIAYVPLDKKESFKSLGGYIDLPYNQLRIVCDYSDLLEKIRIFEQGLNDKAIELCKLHTRMSGSEMLFTHDKILFTGVLDGKINYARLNMDLPEERTYYSMSFDNYSSFLYEKELNTDLILREWQIVDSIYAIGQFYGYKLKRDLIANIEKDNDNLALAHLWP